MRVFVVPFKPNVPEIDGCSPVNFFGVFCFLPGSNGEEQQQEVKHLNKSYIHGCSMTKCSALMSYSLINDAQTSAHQMRKSTCCFTCCSSSSGEADTVMGAEIGYPYLYVSIAFDCQLMSHKLSCSSAFFLTFQTSTHTQMHTHCPRLWLWHGTTNERIVYPNKRP